jgi:hypothetical protein
MAGSTPPDVAAKETNDACVRNLARQQHDTANGERCANPQSAARQQCAGRRVSRDQANIERQMHRHRHDGRRGGSYAVAPLDGFPVMSAIGDRGG